MTPVTSKRRRRMAYMAVGTAAAMVLLPAAASAQGENPIDEVVNPVEELTAPIDGGQAPANPVEQLPNVGTSPSPLQEVGDPDEDDDSPGHETEDPVFPDHASGFVGDLDLLGEDLADITNYDATVENNHSSSSDVTVLALLGEELFGSHAESGGTTEERENLLEPLCEGTGGALCLSLLYSEALADESADMASAGARGGILALCLGGDDEEALSSRDCTGPLTLGVAEGEGAIVRDKDSGHTGAASQNDLARLCLGGQDEAGDICDGLGASVLHADSFSESTTPSTERASYLLALDLSGDRQEILSDPESLTLPNDCEDPALLCLFLNQGESFLFENGAGSAQEALHLSLLGAEEESLVLLELGRAETLVHQTQGKKDGDKPECDDKVDNDGDGKIDFPKDPECDSPQDDSEADGKGDGAGVGGGVGGAADDDLAFTGGDIAPMLASAFALLGLGALTVAGTRRGMGRHTA